MDKALFRCRRTGHADRTAGTRAHARNESRADTAGPLGISPRLARLADTAAQQKEKRRRGCAVRLLIVSLLILIGAVGLALFADADTGHIVIAYGDWTVETSLALAVAAILLAFLALHYLIRLWVGLRAVPYRLRRWRRHRRNAKVQHTYQRGMIALAEGHWQEAEKWLLKHVHHSETPALHYLAAAEAAEDLGSLVRRDSYLRAALTQDPRTEVAVGLAQARYYIEHRDPADASTLLGRLYVTSPIHPAVLKRLMEATIAQGDWERLLGLVPELQRREVITDSKAEELQATAYRPLFAEAIARRWSDALVYAYGLIASDNVTAQLAFAERWLKHHPQNPVLLLTLGRLCVRTQKWGKGRSYLEASIGVDPQPETYREHSTQHERHNNKNEPHESNRKALSLMPNKTFSTSVVPPRYK